MDLTQRKITKIAREISKFTQRSLKLEGIGVAEYDFIHVVRKNPGITQKEVCEKLGIDKGAAARRCRNLENKGYIRKEPHLTDKRSQHLFACEKGNDLKMSKAMIETVAYEWLLEGMDKSEQEQFCQLLDKVYQRCKNESKKEFIHLNEFLEGKLYEENTKPE